MTTAFALSRPKNESKSSIIAIVRYGNKRMNYALSVSIPVKYWDEKKKQVKETKQFPEYFRINNKLIAIRATIFKCFDTYMEENRNEEPSTNVLKRLLDNEFNKKSGGFSKPKLTLLGYLQEIIDRSESGLRVQPQSGKPIAPNTIKTYKTTKLHLTKFAENNSLKLAFDDINLEFYDAYKAYLMKELQLSNNTVGKHFQIIKLVMNEASDNGLTTNTSFRSKRFFVIRETADSIFLTNDEIKALQGLDLSAYKNLDVTRDLFIIGCMTGLRYSDLASLKPENIEKDKIFLEQAKTKIRVVVPINEDVRRVLLKYKTVPKAYSNQKSNQYLKEICKKVKALETIVEKSITKGGKEQKSASQKWELVTTHTARRSFATNEVKKGTPIAFIMAITGHNTEKSFWKYVRLSKEDYANLYIERNKHS